VYEPRNEPHEFIGADRDEAIGKACEFFRTGVEALAIHEPDPREIYGLGSRTVIIAAPLDRKAPAREPRERGGEEGRQAARGRGREGGRDERGGRGEGRGERGERGGRGGRGDRGGRDRGGRRERGREGPERLAEPRREVEEPQEPSVGTAVGELGEVGRYVLGAIERMRLGPFEISESGEENLVVLSIRGVAARALGSGDGRPVDALQLLANQAAMRIEEEPPRVVLDVEGNLEERESRLAELAERAARRARETGRTIALDPMSPRDRRAIHLALRDAQGIATMSVGESRYRQVVVVPEGAPEYEEALREARAAAAAAEGE
jgi:spoIIIJ-associated protein